MGARNDRAKAVLAVSPIVGHAGRNERADQAAAVRPPNVFPSLRDSEVCRAIKIVE
jgi:hypothetical protein